MMTIREEKGEEAKATTLRWFIFHEINTKSKQFRFTKRVKITEDGDITGCVRFAR